MMLNPRVGSVVQVWYRESLRGFMPWHGRTGKVLVACRGKPRNHGVEIDGQIVIVPCGNIRKLVDTTS